MIGAWFTKQAIKGFIGKYGLQLGILIAVLAAAWFLDHRGYQRAQAESHARELERAAITAAAVAAIDQQLDGKLRAIADRLDVRLDTLDREGTTVVQPIITRELERDPRLAAPGSCLTPELLKAVNAARGYPAGELGRDAGSADPQSLPGSADGR